MKVLCAYSGIEFQCQHFPADLYSREAVHPIFYVKQTKLVSYIAKWTAGELTPTDTYLLFLSLLNSTELIEWRVPVVRTQQTDSIVAINMERLVNLIASFNLIKNPLDVLPKFAITPETKTLDTISYWLESWSDAVVEYRTGYRTTNQLNAIRGREQLLEKLIKNSQRDIASYATILADWAELAGSFPRFEMKDPQGIKTTLADYWKSIIKKCCKSESIFEIPADDLAELLEHCETEIPAGSIYHAKLLTLLREGVKRQSSFLGSDFVATKFVVLDADTSVEDANKLLLINSAPEAKPVEKDYPTKVAFLRAKLAYDMKQKYERDLAEHLASPTITTEIGEL